MSKLYNLFNKKNPLPEGFSKEFEALNEEKFFEENKKLAIVPLRIIALITAISGLFALVFEVRYFQQFSVQVYFGRLIATLAAFVISIMTNFDFGRRHPFALIHILLVCIIGSFGSIIYFIPETLVLNANILALVIFTVALFLNWDVKHQIVVAIYYNLVFAGSILLNDNSVYFTPNIFESVLFVIFISLMAIVASSINYRLKRKSIFAAIHSTAIEKKYKSIIENSVEGIFQAAIDGTFQTINPALKKMLGYNDTKDIDKSLNLHNLFKYSEDSKQLSKILERNGKIKNYRTIFKRIDDTEINIKMNVRLVNDPIGKPAYYEGSIQDITQQIIAERERNEAIEELKKSKKSFEINAQKEIQASRSKSDFLSRINHDMRTPINSILGFLSLIEENQFQDNEELKNYAADTKLSVESLLEMINSTLDLSKIESGKMDLEESDFDVRQVVERAVNIYKTMLKKDVNLSYKINEDVPAILIGDSAKYRQILVNLLNNAIKYTAKGDVHVDLTIGKRTNHKLELITYVKDTGIGIKSDLIPNIFEPYQQLHDSKFAENTGPGLGLTICRELVHMMGGKISVKSKVGQGSIFLFTVILKFKSEDTLSHQVVDYSLKTASPSIQLDTPEEKPVVSERAIKDENKHEKPEKIVAAEPERPVLKNNKKLLLVEDNDMNRKVETKLLRQIGYDVDSVTNGEDAITAVRSGKYNLVLMDVEMSGMDGLTATQKIRALEGDISRIPIIAVTAHSSMRYREQCLNGGMNDFMAKPINVRFLKMIIDEWLYKSAV